MTSEQVQCESLPDGSIRITPVGTLEDISLLPAVLAVFEREYRQGYYHFVLDLGLLPALPAGWVALIFEWTARCRRRGGDLCVTHLQRRAQGDLLNFQPETYLCLDEMDFVSSMTLSRPATDQLVRPLPLESTPAGEHFTAERAGESGIMHPAAAAENDFAPQPGFTQNAAPEEARTDLLAPGAADISSAIDIPSRVDALYRACDFVLDIAARLGYGESDLSKIKISVYEASLNAIEHAYHSDATKKVRVEVTAAADKLVIAIIDQGDGFEVKTNDDFDATAAAAARRTGGMGLHIIRRSMDKVTYVRDSRNGNRLIMEKRRPFYSLHNSASFSTSRNKSAEGRHDDQPDSIGEL